MSDATMVRDRDGDLRADVPDAPAHHWRCDGSTGRTLAVDPLERLPVACLACRPHLAVRPHRDGRPTITLDR